MTIAILTILASLVPLLVWWVRREAAKHDDPWQQHENHRETIAKEIIHNDEAAANQSLDDDLERLRSAAVSAGDQPQQPPNAKS